MGKMPLDSANKAMQIFTPARAQVVTATEAWTPLSGDRAFACVVDQGIKLNGGTEFDWPAAAPMGINHDLTYTFSVTSLILVM